MYIPNVPRRIILKVTTKERKRKTRSLRRQRIIVEAGLTKMSHSPSDLAAGWTFVSAPPEVNEETQSDGPLDVTEGESDLKEKCVESPKDMGSNVDRATDDRETEELLNDDDDLPTVSSETESLPSSDVDILEESVGPDHDILEVSSLPPTSSFTISSPLEEISKSQCTSSASMPSELPESQQVNTELKDIIPCESKELLPAISVKSPKCSKQPEPSFKAPDNVSHSKSVMPLQGPDGEPKPTGGEKPAPKDKRRRKNKQITQGLYAEIQEIIREVSSEIRMLALYFVLWFSIVLTLFWLIPCTTNKTMKYLSPKTAAHLKFVQDETLKCLGLQHLTAMENDHYGMLLSNVCVNDSVAWKSNFEKLLEDKVLQPLISAVYNESSIQRKTEIIEGFMSEEKNGVRGIKFDLLLRQLEYLELLHPVEEDSHVKEKHKDSTAAAALFSEKLEEQEQLLGQLHQFIDQLKLGNFLLKRFDTELKSIDGSEDSADLVALKPRVYRLELENVFLSNQLQHMLDQFDSGEFLDPEYWMDSSNLNYANGFRSSKMEELMEKVNSLLSANDELRRMYSHFPDVKLETKDGDETSAGEKPTTSEKLGFSETRIENYESLIKELLGLHHTLTGELMEVRKWNEMLAEITDELRSSHRDKNNGRWVWSSFKHAFDGMFDGAPLDLTQKLKNFQNLDVSGLLHKYAEERKPFIKDVFQSITSFWENTSTKSKEFVEKALREMNTDFSLSGMFNSISGQEGSPGESETSNGNVPEKNPGHVSSDVLDNLPSYRSEGIDLDDDTSDHPELSVSGHERADFDKLKANWLFQRAADRESLRYTSKTKPMNWYMRREQNMWRSPMTKEQAELLEKMEVSQYPSPAKSHSREPIDCKA